MATDEPQIKQATSNSAKPPVQIKIQANLIELLDQTKPDHFDRQTWANWLLDTGIRIKLFSDSPETAFKQQFVEFPKSLGELTGNSTVYVSNKNLKEENTQSTIINNFYGKYPIVEPTTGQPKQKKETDGQKLESAADDVLEQIRLEEINRPLNEKAAELVEENIRDAAKAPPGFDAFWAVYQSCPRDLKAAGQSKKQAREQYRLALKKTTAERLLEAIEKAIKQAKVAEWRGDWIAPLPDCFRWLRDEKWAVFIDGTKTQKPLRKDIVPPIEDLEL